MLLTFLAAFVPLIGAFSAGLAAVLIALVSGGIVKALIVLGARHRRPAGRGAPAVPDHHGPHGQRAPDRDHPRARDRRHPRRASSASSSRCRSSRSPRRRSPTCARRASEPALEPGAARRRALTGARARQPERASSGPASSVVTSADERQERVRARRDDPGVQDVERDRDRHDAAALQQRADRARLARGRSRPRARPRPPATIFTTTTAAMIAEHLRERVGVQRARAGSCAARRRRGRPAAARRARARRAGASRKAAENPALRTAMPTTSGPMSTVPSSALPPTPAPSAITSSAATATRGEQAHPARARERRGDRDDDRARGDDQRELARARRRSPPRIATPDTMSASVVTHAPVAMTIAAELAAQQPALLEDPRGDRHALRGERRRQREHEREARAVGPAPAAVRPTATPRRRPRRTRHRAPTTENASRRIVPARRAIGAGSIVMPDEQHVEDHPDGPDGRQHVDGDRREQRAGDARRRPRRRRRPRSARRARSARRGSRRSSRPRCAARRGAPRARRRSARRRRRARGPATTSSASGMRPTSIGATAPRRVAASIRPSGERRAVNLRQPSMVAPIELVQSDRRHHARSTP